MIKKVFLNISRYFFLLLFLGFFVSMNFFNHVHLVDGNTIVHSHPYKKSPAGTPMHNHSPEGYLLIHFLSEVAAVSIAALIIIRLFLILLYRYRISESVVISFQKFLNPNYLRGPPQVEY
jgi:hypothetical protein